MFCCPDSNFPSRSCRYPGGFIKFFSGAAAVITLLAAVSAWASSGYPGEISNIAVQNQTPTTVDIVWDTVHPSSSQVVLARDQNYAGERRIPLTPDPALVNHHKVTVDRLMPYDSSQAQGTYYFYVASADVNNVTSTAPGPDDDGSGDPSTYLLPLQTAPPDPNGKSNYVVYTYGPTDVYAGSDFYFGMKVAQLAGNHPNIYVHNVGGYNNGTDGVVKGLIGRTPKPMNPQTISVHLECYEYNPSNSDAYDQYFDSGKNLGECWNFEYHLLTVRLRTAANTVPGIYSVTVTLEDNGQVVPTTYYVNVLTPPIAPVVRNYYPSPIPSKDTWESNMTQYGHKFCDDLNYSGSRDSLNAAGTFLTSWANEGDAWYYDGGRVYQQIASYTNDPSWNHCALTILDPYRQWISANNAQMDVWAIFPYGMLMNYWRTGDTTNSNAIHLLATNSGSANYGGWVDPYAIRETAYIADVRIADELITGKRDRLLAKNIDKLLGHLDMVYNGQLGASHPFMVGLAMETAIHYYDMTVAEGHPDYRVPAAVKHALDGLWRDYYVPSTHAFRYTRWDVPTQDTWFLLNNLVAPAYAWYWSLTGDAASLSHGDELFQHTLDDPSNTIFTGKQFSQVYKWSFDYLRYRTGDATSTTVKDNNPFGGPYPDTEPPIESKVVVGNITNNTATITWTTYENSNSQIIYGVVGGYYPLHSAVYDSGQGVMSHTVTLTGLTAGTTYHYRINSHDAANNLASLADATFTTTGRGSGGGGGTLGSSGGSGTSTPVTEDGSDSTGNTAGASSSGSGTGTSSANGSNSGSGTAAGVRSDISSSKTLSE
jgi:hypothetical protein